MQKIILESPEDYSKALLEVPDLHGYKTWTLKKHTLIFQSDYRGKRLPLGENRENFPNFFYDLETCNSFLHCDISEFSCKTNPYLFEFSMENILKLYEDERLSESDLTLLDMFIGCSISSDPSEEIKYVKPNLFLDGTILKREIAKMILKLGFDGWICFSDLHVHAWNTCIQNEDCKELSLYRSEIMLSCWNHFLDT
jgi:hypothetical protein